MIKRVYLPPFVVRMIKGLAKPGLTEDQIVNGFLRKAGLLIPEINREGKGKWKGPSFDLDNDSRAIARRIDADLSFTKRYYEPIPIIISAASYRSYCEGRGRSINRPDLIEFLGGLDNDSEED